VLALVADAHQMQTAAIHQYGSSGGSRAVAESQVPATPAHQRQQPQYLTLAPGTPAAPQYLTLPLATPMMQQGQYLAAPTPSAAVGYGPMFAPQQMIPAYTFAPATPEATPRPVAPTPRPSKRKRQEQKPAEKKQRKSAVASRALELHKREMEQYSVSVLLPSVTFCSGKQASTRRG